MEPDGTEAGLSEVGHLAAGRTHPGRSWACRGRRVGALGLLLFAATLAVIWWVGQDRWGDGARRLTTPIADVQDLLDAMDPGQPLRVAVIGDIQKGHSECRDLLDRTAQLNPDLILLLGDAVNNAQPGRYAALRATVAGHLPKAPLVSVPGNHDVTRDGDALDVYREWIGPIHWRLDWEQQAGASGEAPVRWVLLGLDNAKGPLTPESEALWAAVAAEGPQARLVVAAHRPMKGTSPMAPAVQLAGHVHSSSRFDDAAGTLHIHHGDNCDRSRNAPKDSQPTVGMLTFSGGEVTWTSASVPRQIDTVVELQRIAVGDVYPLMRNNTALTALLLVALLAAAVRLWHSPATEPAAQ